ncbi:MAG: hypothetical protein ACOYN0_08530 [Phycisphaerales bacterium]
MILKCTNAGLSMPTAGTSVGLESSTIVYVTVPGAGTAGDAVIEGVAGPSTRRVRVTLEGR